MSNKNNNSSNEEKAQVILWTHELRFSCGYCNKYPPDNKGRSVSAILKHSETCLSYQTTQAKQPDIDKKKGLASQIIEQNKEKKMLL